MDNFNICHLNINGLRGKLEEFKLFVCDNKPDIICLNETKLSDQEPPLLPGYNVA